MVSYGDSIDTHLDDGVIVAAGTCHVAEVENILFCDVELFHEVSHAESLIHTRGDGVNRGSAADFVIKLGGEFFASCDDLFAFFAIWVPGVFFLGASVLAKGRESDLREAIFDDFIAFGELSFFPEAEFTGGLFDSLGDFGNLLIC